MREDLFDKVSKPLRDSMRSMLSLYLTFMDFHEQLSLLYWELEAEKKCSPCMTERLTTPTRKPTTTSHATASTTTIGDAKRERPKYDDKCKVDLSLKGACFNCEQVSHLAKDCPQKSSIKVLEVNEESDSDESGKENP